MVLLPDWIAEWLPFAVIFGIGAWWTRFEAREAERRRTAPERARRRLRDLEHRMLVQAGAEQLLRRMLIEDLRQVKAKREAYEQIRTEFGLDLEQPTEIPTLRDSLYRRRHRRRRLDSPGRSGRLQPTASERGDTATRDPERNVLRNVDANK